MGKTCLGRGTHCHIRASSLSSIGYNPVIIGYDMKQGRYLIYTVFHKLRHSTFGYSTNVGRFSQEAQLSHKDRFRSFAVFLRMESSEGNGMRTFANDGWPYAGIGHIISYI